MVYIVGVAGSECPKCAELMRHIEVLERKIGWILAKLTKAEGKVRRLQEQLAGSKKDSTNSSEPPSPDIVKPPQKASVRERRRGAQIGHAPQQRPPFEPGQIDIIQWTWVFRAPQFTLFHIDPSRGASVLEQVLGSEFSGTLQSDFYSAHRS